MDGLVEESFKFIKKSLIIFEYVDLRIKMTVDGYERTGKFKKKKFHLDYFGYSRKFKDYGMPALSQLRICNLQLYSLEDMRWKVEIKYGWDSRCVFQTHKKIVDYFRMCGFKDKNNLIVTKELENSRRKSFS